MVSLETLLMNPFLVPSFWPVAAAIDRIGIIGHVKVTVFNGMNVFCVHDKSINTVTVLKHFLKCLPLFASIQCDVDEHFHVQSHTSVHHHLACSVGRSQPLLGLDLYQPCYRLCLEWTQDEAVLLHRV
jgi:hypothetical protein